MYSIGINNPFGLNNHFPVPVSDTYNPNSYIFDGISTDSSSNYNTNNNSHSYRNAFQPSSIQTTRITTTQSFNSIIKRLEEQKRKLDNIYSDYENTEFDYAYNEDINALKAIGCLVFMIPATQLHCLHPDIAIKAVYVDVMRVANSKHPSFPHNYRKMPDRDYLQAIAKNCYLLPLTYKEYSKINGSTYLFYDKEGMFEQYDSKVDPLTTPLVNQEQWGILRYMNISDRLCFEQKKNIPLEEHHWMHIKCNVCDTIYTINEYGRLEDKEYYFKDAIDFITKNCDIIQGVTVIYNIILQYICDHTVDVHEWERIYKLEDDKLKVKINEDKELQQELQTHIK